MKLPATYYVTFTSFTISSVILEINLLKRRVFVLLELLFVYFFNKSKFLKW